MYFQKNVDGLKMLFLLDFLINYFCLAHLANFIIIFTSIARFAYIHLVYNVGF